MQYIRRWRPFSGVLALLLVLSSISSADAAVTQNVSNPSFGRLNGCTDAGWTQSGWMAPRREGAEGNCALRMTAVHDLSVSPSKIINSKVEQSFYLSSSDPTIYFYYKSTIGSHSDLCGMKFRLYDAAGKLIYEEAITARMNNHVLLGTSRGFPGYAGQQVKLSIEIYVLNPQPGAMNKQYLELDFQLTTDHIIPSDPDPELPGGGGA
jgi:hypothetical protein